MMERRARAVYSVVALALFGASSCRCARERREEVRADRTPAVRANDLGDACATYAQHHCARLAHCARQFLLELYPDEAACGREEKDACLTVLAIAESRVTADDVARCDAVHNGDCEAVIERSVDSCVVPGPRPQGAPCAGHAQCATRLCHRPDAHDACGTCTRGPDEGEPCDDGLCANDLLCFDGTCGRWPGLGEGCHSTCAGDLSCTRGVCSPSAKAGEPCDILGHDAPDCGLFAGLVCYEGACVPEVFVEVGEACGDLRTCKGGARCIEDHCVADVGEGAPCGDEEDPQQLPSCRRPLRCINGVCTRHELHACAP